MANFEAFRWNISLSANLLFMKSECAMVRWGYQARARIALGTQVKNFVKVGQHNNKCNCLRWSKNKIVLMFKFPVHFLKSDTTYVHLKGE